MTSNRSDDLSGIADWLVGYTGISTAIIGSHSLRRAVQERLRSTGLPSAIAYQDLLLASAEEQQELVELVVVPETWFFRDRHPYAYLREHVNRLLRDGLPSQPLRLLSAPCATGEEPYSMAMTLLDMGLPKDSFRIDAIDISRQSIRRARQAVYGKHSFRGVSEAEQQKHFQATAQGLEPHPAIRQSVQLRRANLMVALAEMAIPYDVIFCRNLLIYLEDGASQRLLEAMAALMKPGALLIVGAAETGKVPLALFDAIREPFVFGYWRRDPQSSPAPPAAAIPAAAPPIAAPSTSTRAPRSARPRSAAPLATAAALAVPPASQAGRQPRTLRAPLPVSAIRTPVPAPSLPAARRPRAAAGAKERSTAALAPTDLQRLQEEIARDPSSDAAYLKLALAMLRHNRSQEALECLQRCLYLNPNSREALRAMIQLTQNLGLIERSRQFQGRLARLEP